MSVDKHNKIAWDLASKEALLWNKPMSKEDIEAAKKGELGLKVTATKKIPKNWIGDVRGKKVLLLAGAGGQQSVLLSAAGAKVTVLDISKGQLLLDSKNLKEHGLSCHLICESYQYMSEMEAESFDLIVNPVSNCFFEDLNIMWKESYRILKSSGTMIFGFINPICFQFDFELGNRGIFTLKYSQPYSDQSSLDETEKARFLREETPLEFGHSLTDQISTPLSVGFAIKGFYEDGWGCQDDRPIEKYVKVTT